MVTVMCDLGATRSQTAGRIADEAAVLGLYAGVAGGVLAAVAGVIVLLLAIPGTTLNTLPEMILPVDLVPIAAVPLMTAIVSGAGARAAAGHFHGQATGIEARGLAQQPGCLLSSSQPMVADGSMGQVVRL